MNKLLLPILALCMIGCQKVSVNTPHGNFVEVGFSSNIPNIAFENESLVQTRAYDRPKYLVQVYAGSGPYAYGVFEDITSQKIMLEKGITYKMDVAYYPNGHEKRFHDPANDTFTDEFVYSIKDKIDPDGHFADLSDYYYLSPCVKYYAKDIMYTASSDNPNINIDLEAWVCSLSFNAKNLTKGYIKISSSVGTVSYGLTNSITLSPAKPNHEAVYSMSAKSIMPKIVISYVNEASVEIKIYEGEIPIERLKKTIVNINLKPASNESESSFTVDLEDIFITEGETIDLNQE